MKRLIKDVFNELWAYSTGFLIAVTIERNHLWEIVLIYVITCIVFLFVSNLDGIKNEMGKGKK